jgi:hypothetical protein
MIIAAAIVLVILVVGAVAWIVTRGSTSKPAAAPTAASSERRPTATATVAEYFKALDQHNLADANEYLCDGTKLTMTQAQVDLVKSVKSEGPAQVSGKTAVEHGVVKATDGSTAAITVELGQLPGRLWCISSTHGS